jgi:alpha-tubulin suppressor-like RCC1 family protein
MILGLLAIGCLLPSPPAAAQSAAPQVTALGVEAGWRHACAILLDGTVKCWGSNGSGALGQEQSGNNMGDQPGEMGAALPASNLGTGLRALSMSSGWDFNCALLGSGQVKCWGDNGSGQLGQGHTTALGNGPGEMGDALAPVDLGAGRSAVALSAGGAHVCALLDNGQVKCWGSNIAGQLGQGDTANRGDSAGEMGDALPPVDLGNFRTAIAIAAGWRHTCALLDNHQVKCWGLNASGQLGLGDTASRGDAVGEMGNSLLQVSLGAGRSARAVAAGIRHSCALLDNGQMKCWGENSIGQLGQGDTDDRGNAPGEMGDLLAPIDLGTDLTAVAIAAGNYHTCAVTNLARIKCWGANHHGALGLGDTSHRGDNAGEMGDALPFVNLGGFLKTLVLANAVTAGEHSTCARTSSGTVKCWGQNQYGELGLGDTLDRGDGAGEMGNALPSLVLF